ncbi:MAG: DMT family transporter, partial [Burkholderiaceae bacterium]
MLGIALMLGFCSMAPVADAIAKLLGETIPLGQLLFVRFATQGGILLLVVWFSGRSLMMSRRVFWLSTWRTLLHIAGIAAMFSSLRFLPLADAIAIAFVMPFILLLIGKLFLNERVGPYRLGGCIVGFSGSLLVIKPSFASVGLPALLPLVVAFTFAFFILVTRQIARDIDPVSLQAANGLLGALILFIGFWLWPVADWPAFQWVHAGQLETMLLAAVGILGTVAHLLMTWSLRFAPSATLAPVQYVEIPLAALVGWLVFADLPDGQAAVGIGIIFAAG